MHLHIIPVTPLEQNCSLLVCPDTNKAALIDPGGDAQMLIEKVAGLNVEMEKLFLTHGHMDHAGAATELSEHWQIPIEGPHSQDDFLLQTISQWCQEFGLEPGRNVTPNRWLNQGDQIQFGNQSLDVFHCPGHTPGHLVFLHQASQLAFVGDVLFKGSIGRTDFPKGDHQQLQDSIKNRLLPLGDDIRFVPGHGPTSTLGHERLYNPFIN